MSVNETIKRLRTERKLTQNDLAELMNCNRQKIADLERGKSTPSANDLILLSKIFNVSADYLLGITDVQTKDKDVKFICDYTGLSERAIEVLSIYNNSKRTKNKLTPIIDKLLKSHKLTYICCCIDEFSEAIEQKNNALDCLMTEDLKTSETQEEKENDFEEYEKLTDKADLNLFRLQEAITDFAKICCWNTLKEVNKKEDKINDLINNYIGEEENVFVNYIEVDGENNVNNP